MKGHSEFKTYTFLRQVADIGSGGRCHLTLEAITDQLASLYEHGDTYRFIEQAHQVLAAAPVVPALARLTLRALVDLGLGGPARELMQMRSDLDAADTAIAELSRTAGALPNGRVPWSDLRPQFERNAAALLRHRPELAPHIQAAPQLLGQVHLYRLADGTYQVSSRRPGALRRWMPPLTLREEESNAPIPARGELGPTILIGLRISPLLERVYRDTHRLYLSYSHPVYVLEPEPVYLAAWLHCADAESLLDDERVCCLVGAQAVQALEQLLVGEATLPLPAYCVDQARKPVFAEQALKVAERVAAQREAELAKLSKLLRDRYAGRGPAYWSGHLRPPATVLGITSRYTTVLQYSTRDALEAFERLGYRTRMLREERDHHRLSGIQVCREVLETEPALVLLLDHLRYEQSYLPPELPILTWIQDPLSNLFCPQAGASVGPCDFVCGYFQQRCTEEFGYPADAFAYADVPISTSVFHDGDLDDATRQRYRCAVCFVSNASAPLERLHVDLLREYPEMLQPMLEHLYAQIAAALGRDEQPRLSDLAGQLVRQAAEDLGIALNPADAQSLTTHYAYRLLDWGRRQQTLEWVGDWARRTGRVFRIYGRGWEDHPTLAEFAGGILEHGEPLRAAYRASSLALQLIPSGFWHQRSYEMLASGTLPLTRFCPDDFNFLPMDEFIRRRDSGEKLGGAAGCFPGLERVVFRTAAEFATLAERFMGNAAYRQAVQKELRGIVLRDYTYDAVLRNVMAAFGERLGRQANTCRS